MYVFSSIVIFVLLSLLQQEKQAKREANKAEKEKEKEKEKGKENETEFVEPETPSKSVRTRGAKRQVESSPTEASDSKRRKGRARKNGAMNDASILTVLDEELQKRAVKKEVWNISTLSYSKKIQS